MANIDRTPSPRRKHSASCLARHPTPRKTPCLARHPTPRKTPWLGSLHGSRAFMSRKTPRLVRLRGSQAVNKHRQPGSPPLHASQDSMARKPPKTQERIPLLMPRKTHLTSPAATEVQHLLLPFFRCFHHRIPTAHCAWPPRLPLYCVCVYAHLFRPSTFYVAHLPSLWKSFYGNHSFPIPYQDLLLR